MHEENPKLELRETAAQSIDHVDDGLIRNVEEVEVQLLNERATRCQVRLYCAMNCFSIRFRAYPEQEPYLII